MKEKATTTAAEAAELGKEGWAGAKDLGKEGWAGAKQATAQGWRCCFKKGEQRERSLAMGLLPIILTIGVSSWFRFLESTHNS